MEDQEIISEFLIESNENLARLDQEMVQLEERPNDTELLSSIFRTVHTIKGTCGFLGFTKLERITHLAENILSQLRSHDRALTPDLVSLILETVDAIKRVLTSIEADGTEGEDSHEELARRLREAASESEQRAGESPAAAATPSAPPEEPAEVSGAGGSAAPGPGEESKNQAEQKSLSLAESTIRVDVGVLDNLMNLVGELVLARNQILQFNAHQDDSTLNTTSQRLNLITTELQERVMKTRMQPIRVIWNKLPRVVRDMAHASGKQIALEMDGSETELDRTIIEAIKDPLTHIVRNCCDHGIERPEARAARGKPAQGKMTLRAFHEGGQVNIEISDDGAGIDVERVKSLAVEKGILRSDDADRMGDREAQNLIFNPGFSTAKKVTNVSGRGVGMDVVKTNIEKIGGLVDLFSRPGEGTTVKLKIPLTLAIIPGLVVSSGGESFVIPQVSLLELIRLEGDAAGKQIEQIHGTPVYRRRGKLLPLAYLNDVIGLASDSGSKLLNIVVLQAGDRQFGLVVDRISDTQEIVVKPLGKQLKGLDCYAGATIMGDGRVALILDVLGIGKRSGVVAEMADQSRHEKAEQRDRAAGAARQTLMLFRAGSFERVAVPLALVARLEEFPQSKIERSSGRLVTQYRGTILPLASLGPLLGPGSDDAASRQDPAQAIVFDDGQHPIGFLVDQILDIVEDTVTIRQQTSHPGLLGSAVLGGKVTDMLDLNTVIKRAVDGWLTAGGDEPKETIVLVADGAAYSRVLMRGYLEMAGYLVVEASSVEQALDQLEGRLVDIVLAALDLPSGGAEGLWEQMHQRPDLAGVPVIAMANCPEDLKGPKGKEDYFAECEMKLDREAMLRSVERLALAVEQERPVAELAGRVA